MSWLVVTKLSLPSKIVLPSQMMLGEEKGWCGVTKNISMVYMYYVWRNSVKYWFAFCGIDKGVLNSLFRNGKNVKWIIKGNNNTCLCMIDCKMEAKGVIPIPVPIRTACSAL